MPAAASMLSSATDGVAIVESFNTAAAGPKLCERTASKAELDKSLEPPKNVYKKEKPGVGNQRFIPALAMERLCMRLFLPRRIILAQHAASKWPLTDGLPFSPDYQDSIEFRRPRSMKRGREDEAKSRPSAKRDSLPSR